MAGYIGLPLMAGCHRLGRETSLADDDASTEFAHQTPVVTLQLQLLFKYHLKTAEMFQFWMVEHILHK